MARLITVASLAYLPPLLPLRYLPPFSLRARLPSSSLLVIPLSSLLTHTHTHTNTLSASTFSPLNHPPSSVQTSSTSSQPPILTSFPLPP
ncbi:hypothetical protein IE53DRAFT_64546 [Violaceomyces palustris]|uniref:Uncharacterized protein n=1 Tax=Violaceomyces palustris TaxID=1673888 RepID=A0ACD0P7F8_9BASI|nr:hypothetical protein IE53DRAFT_64546 [Violaceomyces palustris]